MVYDCWRDLRPGAILSGVEGAYSMKCTASSVTFSIRHGGANDVHTFRHKTLPTSDL